MSDARTDSPSLSRARSMFAKGDFLNAIDVLRAITEPLSERDKRDRDYLIVLALARAGATKQALQAFDSTLSESADDAPIGEARKIAALRARCLKDLAFERIELRRERLLSAAQAYESAFTRFGGYYPLINAATLRLLAGETSEARKLSERVLIELESHREIGDDEAYWRLVTKAEACLVLGSIPEAADAIGAAAGVGNVSASDLATTKKQLLAVCRFHGFDPDVVAPLRIPRPLRYCGHRHLWNEGSENHRESGMEHRLSRAIGDFLESHDVGYAYGCLASGADTIIAESVLSRGLELNLVFPFKLDQFIRISVAPAGEEWIRRFESCLRQAHSVSYVLDDDFLEDDCMFAQCGSHSMGMAELRARNMAIEPLQLAVWNGEAAKATAGTANEVAQWVSLGFESHVLSPEGEFAAQSSTLPAPIPTSEDRIRVRSFLFADVSGFSRLREVHLVPFVEKFLGCMGQVIGRFDSGIDHRETAGDGIYLVMRDPAQAAECALEMQRQVREFDFEGAGLPSTLNLRIAIHHGPGQVVTDPILHLRKLVGREITRAARMEPITPLGEVYVTEQMACALSLAGKAGAFTCEYVGMVPSAKAFGSFRMYSLKFCGI